MLSPEISDLVQHQDVVAELVNLLDATRLAQIDELDELVSDLCNDTASKINNGGIGEQVKLIVSKLGAEDARNRIESIAQQHESVHSPQ